MEPSDSQLLERWRRGDRAAGKVLFERYYDMVARFFVNKVSGNANDLVQETFLACVEGRDRLNDEGRFRSYLFSIAYYVLRGHLRKRYRAGAQIAMDEVTMHDLSPGPSTLAARRREERLLLEGLRAIPVDCQVLLELHYWEQLTTAEMAEVVGAPVGTVRSRLLRARELLDQAMARLARSPGELKSTITRLDDWAHECRRKMDMDLAEQT